MKKLMIVLGLAATFSGSVMAEEVITEDPSTFANGPIITTGNISFFGEVAKHTCSIAELSNNQLVRLPKVSIDDLNKNKSGYGDSNFSIELEKCTLFKDQAVSILFKPTEVEDHLLANTANNEHKAKNVFVKLSQDGRQIMLGHNDNEHQSVSSLSIDLDKAAPSTKFSFTAQYVVKDGKEASTGLYQATLPFEVVYK